ncbi:WD40 repeat domain-containing serine/threonine protein kinase [Thermobifida cellulosilytica]|uniref:Protein kinase domain-containing protein n=1 Tax=Thermobifida cellulosilytica TB100 TaxID=665004 RepID=A0A147KGQ5_THECS|nr:serine/threonine-protein kinase [Thermobifida cellulosilytica]KUP96494.1 hypothetical protein AC529_12125 [Thermobifida cellulosilytica TB100]
MEPLLPGDPEQVGPYRLVNRLGAGGMGQVFLARSPGGRPVVVKVIRPEHVSDSEYRVRFAREVEAARRVGGFHTAQIVDADPDADPPWMAAAYVPGPSLDQAVRQRGPLDEHALWTLAAGLAEGLTAIHSCGLVHRDFKPGNIILAADGPRIIDFGIARPTDASTMTQTGAVIGTLSYMSPEQVQGQPVGRASDIFSFGTVLAFAATGQSPFAAETLGAIVMRLISPPPELPQLSPDLRELIRACWAQRPDERPTAADLLARIGGRAGADWPPPHLADLVGTALPVGAAVPPPPPAPPPSDITPQRWEGEEPGGGGEAESSPRTGATLRQSDANAAQGKKQSQDNAGCWSATLMLIPVVALAWGWVDSLPATPDLVLPGQESYSGAPLVTDIEESVRAVAFSPDGSRLVVAAENIRVWDFESGEFLDFLDEDDEEKTCTMVTALAFSRDGSTLAAGCDNGALRLWDFESGQQTATLVNPDRYESFDCRITGVTFDEDGAVVASVAADDVVQRWDVASGELLSAAGPSDPEHMEYATANPEALHPGGLLLATEYEYDHVRLWDAESGEGGPVLQGAEDNYSVEALAFSPDGSLLARGGGEAIDVWEAESGRLLLSIAHSGSQWWFEDLVFSPDGSLLASLDSDDRAYLWDLGEGGEEVDSFSRATALAFHPDGSVVVSGNEEGDVELHYLEDPQGG